MPHVSPDFQGNAFPGQLILHQTTGIINSTRPLSFPHARCQFHTPVVSSTFNTPVVISTRPLSIPHARCQFHTPVVGSSHALLISCPCFCCCIHQVLIGDVQIHVMLSSSPFEESQFPVFRAAACEFGQKALFLAAWLRSGEFNCFFQTKFLVSREGP